MSLKPFQNRLPSLGLATLRPKAVTTNFNASRRQTDRQTMAGLEQGLSLCIFSPRSHLKGIKKWYPPQKLQYKTIIDDKMEKHVSSHKDKDQEILWKVTCPPFFLPWGIIFLKRSQKMLLRSSRKWFVLSHISLSQGLANFLYKGRQSIFWPRGRLRIPCRYVYRKKTNIHKMFIGEIQDVTTTECNFLF